MASLALCARERGGGAGGKGNVFKTFAISAGEDYHLARRCIDHVIPRDDFYQKKGGGRGGRIFGNLGEEFALIYM